ncbi:hypothetical protein [Asaia lannensis]|uniref:hypothetical protein n=1 Tax=Asaia lannensis TaxID=415421 RepID=UPI0038730C04
MSETTKRAIPTDLMDTSTHWCERVDATHLIAKPVPYHAARANLRAAEGGVEDETTNSPAEIGTACAGRKTAVVRCILGGGLVCATWLSWGTHFGWVFGTEAAFVEVALIAIFLTLRDMARGGR